MSETQNAEMSYKDEFIKLFKENIKRDGADAVLSWLESSDFFTAPASTRFHLAEEGGLVQHSINVFRNLANEAWLHTRKTGQKYSNETIAIVALLHDICKANFYKVDKKNVKNAKGSWEEVPYYTVNDTFPYGHGEKSVMMLMQLGLYLSTEEMMAIRWHMGGFDDAVKGGSYSMNTACEKYPLVVLLQVSDMKATYIDEVR